MRFPQLAQDLHSRGQSSTNVQPPTGCAPEQDERQALQRLAAWCYQYSDQVCIPGDRSGLFLEAGASERLFGRTEHLGRRLEQELGQLGYSAVAGSAPTPEAAWLAATIRLPWYCRATDRIVAGGSTILAYLLLRYPVASDTVTSG